MKNRELIDYLLLALFLIVPLISIYLILNTLNWNKGEGLFPESWFVFFAWLASSLAAVIFTAVVDDNFYSFYQFSFYALLLPLIISLNVVSIACALTYRSKEREENFSVINEFKDEKKHKKIWRTAFIVSGLTLAVTISLFSFMDKVSNKLENLNLKPVYGTHD